MRCSSPAITRWQGLRWAVKRAPGPGAPRLASSSHRAAATPNLVHPVIFHPAFRINPVPEGHRFPMPKDALLFEKLQSLGLAASTFTPTYPETDTLCLVHDRQYVESFLDGSIPPQLMKRIGLAWSAPLVQRTLIGVGSAILAARLALQYGIGCMTNGGTHHAHRDYGSGWCIFNDQAVAARAAQRDAGVGQILFVDLDVHQGDGTASIFQGDSSVFTLSVHCEAQPFPSPLQHSDLDVPLPAGTTDEQYIQALREVLPEVMAEVRPELIMYNAGVDVHGEDSLGKMALTNQGILERDRFVFATCAQFGVPVACAIGGGYQPDHEHIVDRHVLLHRAAAEYLPQLAAARWQAAAGRRGRNA